MRILKFGGTSMATSESRGLCARLVQNCRQKGPVVVVVSAVAGVTELLEEAGGAAASGNQTLLRRHLAELRDRHPGGDTGLLAELERVLFGLEALGDLTPRSRDLVLSFGERLSAPLLAAELGSGAEVFVGGRAGILTDERWGEAEPLAEVTRYELSRRLGAVLEAGRIPIVTGFLGATQHGVITTLGRGGSDFTATLVGAALKAEEVWLCSDVNGICSADPRLVPEARRLDRISFAEALEMVQFGAKGIHPRALEPSVESGIPIRIVNTWEPENEGTWIGPEAPSPATGTVRSVHLVREVALITVGGASMVGRPGTAGKVFETVAETGANVLMISQSVSEAGISLAVRRGEAARVRAALEGRLVRGGFVRRIDVLPEVGIVAVVGEAMGGTPGVAAQVFRSVANGGINVVAIAQGSSELSISFIVDAEKGPDAIRALHKELLS